MAQSLKFQCQTGCTECCRQRGFVYISEADLARIAGFLGMSAESFERQYVYRTRHLLRLRVPRGARCPFLQGEGCGIHAVKPVQCRVFPFWPEMVESREEWLHTAQYCPGIGKGSLIQIESARSLSAEMHEQYPGLYR
jgi:hypothetical protein